MKRTGTGLTPPRSGEEVRAQKGKQVKRYARRMWNDRSLYLMALPGILYFIIFKYVPMYGVIIAFKDYDIFRGIGASPWVGMYNFQKLFTTAAFQNALRNTVIIGLAKVFIGFPIPVILALMVNAISCAPYRKLSQTALFLPYFISWVVISGLMYNIFSPQSGAFPELLRLFGYKGSIPNILQTPKTFKAVLVISYIWRESGYSVVIYMAAIAGIDSQLYEAASIDGAGKLRQIWNITLPSIRTTIIVMLILRMGSILDAGFDQVFVMTNPIVNRTADIIDTYVYQLGIKEAKYQFATAAGLFKSLVSVVFILATNFVAKKIDEESGLI